MRALALSIWLMLSTTACLNFGGTEAPILKAGSKPFVFDASRVSRLEMSIYDPESSVRWSATLARRGEAWVFESANPPGGGAQLGDRLANDKLIVHLLDTLTTVTLRGQVPEAPASRYALDPPQGALRWQADDRSFELELGAASAPDARGYYRYARFGGQSVVYEIQGAFLQMIENLSRFERLRRSTWPLLAADDVDTIELRMPGQKPVLALRGGLQWEDRQGKLLPHSKKIASALEAWSHLQVLDFLDDPAQGQKALAALRDNSTRVEIVMKDRAKQPTHFVIVSHDGHIYGSQSTRGTAPVELYPRTLELIRALASR